MFWTPLVRRERCLTRWPCLLMPQGSFIVHTVLTLLRMVMQIIYVNDDFNVEEAEGLAPHRRPGCWQADCRRRPGVWAVEGQTAAWLPCHAAGVHVCGAKESPVAVQGAIYLLSDPDARTAGSCLKR